MKGLLQALAQQVEKMSAQSVEREMEHNLQALGETVNQKLEEKQTKRKMIKE